MADTDPPAWRRALGWGAWVLVVAIVVVAWAVPDAPSRLRALVSPVATMPADCELLDGPCTVTFPDGATVTLGVEPATAPPDHPLTFVVQTGGLGAPDEIALMGVDMYMGRLTPTLSPANDGPGWTADLTLPVCTTDRMLWRVDVAVEDRLAVFEMWSLSR